MHTIEALIANKRRYRLHSWPCLSCLHHSTNEKTGDKRMFLVSQVERQETQLIEEKYTATSNGALSLRPPAHRSKTKPTSKAKLKPEAESQCHRVCHLQHNAEAQVESTRVEQIKSNGMT